MKRSRRVLALGILASLAAAAGLTARHDPAPPPLDRRSVEVLTGAEASAFVAGKLRTDPTFARSQQAARQHLLGLGLKPTSIHVVYRFTPDLADARPGLLERLARRLVPAVAAQTFARGGGGWVTFSSWDDGRPNTWEGNLYANDGYGRWHSINLQFEIAEVRHLYWVYTVGGAGPGGTQLQVEGPAPGKEGTRPLHALLDLFLPVAEASHRFCGCYKPGWPECMVHSAMEDSAGECAKSVGICLASGPLYWKCVALSCGVNFGYHYVAHMRQVWNQCNN